MLILQVKFSRMDESTGTLLCGYCTFTHGETAVVVNHCIEEHPNDDLKLVYLCEETGKHKTISKKFPVMGKSLEQKQYTIDDDLCLSVSDLSLTPGKSPAAKVAVISKSQTLKKNNLFGTFADDDEQVTAESITSDIADLNVEDELSSMINLLPDVVSVLKQNGQLANWVKLFRLLSTNAFPLDNICFLLFTDLVKFLSLDTTTCMRYDPVVKKFWATGRQLFHGKCIRFMSGFKNVGQLVEKQCKRGDYRPDYSHSC